MNRALTWSATHPRLALLFAVVLTLGLGWGGLQLRFDGSTVQLFEDRGPESASYQEFRANFGSDEWVVLVAAGPELMTPPQLAWLRERIHHLEGGEGVRRIESVFHLTRQVRKGRWVFSEPLIGEIPQEGSDAMDALRRSLREDARIQGRLLNTSGESLCVLVELDPVLAEQRGETALVAGLVQRWESEAAQAPPGLELFAVGVPLIHRELKEATKRDLAKILPLAVLALWLGLIPFLRGWTALVILLVSSLLASIATFSLIGWAGFPLTVVLYPVVVLVVIVTCAEDLYLMAEYREGLRSGLSPQDALARLGPKLGFTLLITATTSALGFSVLALSANVQMQRFALVGALGIALGFVYTVVVVPALLALLPPPRERALKLPRPVRVLRLILVRMRPRQRRVVGLICVAFFLLVSLGIPRVVVDTVFFDYLPKSSPLLQNVARYRELYGGLSYVSIVLESHEPGGILKPESLLAMQRFQTFLEEQGGIVHSYLDLVDVMARWLGLSGDRSREALFISPQLEEVLSFIPPELSREYLDHDASRARFLLQIHAPSTRDLLDLESRVLAYSDPTLPLQATFQLKGGRVLVAHTADRIARELPTGLVALSLLVAVILALVLRSSRMGTAALLPNLLPILATLGLMGWLEIPLSLGTFFVGAIALGVSVNDTIHLLLRYQKLQSQGASGPRALRLTLHQKSVPVLATGGSLAAGCAVACLSELSNIRDSGILLAFAILAASAADLLVTPLFLGHSRGRGPLIPPTGP